MRQLTPVMHDVLWYMGHGYKLTYRRGRAWMSSPQGEKQKNIHVNTVWALRNRKLISTTYEDDGRHFLTPEGKAAVNDHKPESKLA